METDLSENTTWHLIDDIENLRRHLQVTDWLLFETSGGRRSPLPMRRPIQPAWRPWCMPALPTRDRLADTRNGSPLSRGTPPHRSIAEDHRSIGVTEGYRRLLDAPDMQPRVKAASILLADPTGFPRRWKDPRHLLTRAWIITHYFSLGGWLKTVACCATPIG